MRRSGLHSVYALPVTLEYHIVLCYTRSFRSLRHQSEYPFC